MSDRPTTHKQCKSDDEQHTNNVKGMSPKVLRAETGCLAETLAEH
jgi:hypothetical protein